jgi:hypothetical protein
MQSINATLFAGIIFCLKEYLLLLTVSLGFVSYGKGSLLLIPYETSNNHLQAHKHIIKT